MSVLVNVCMCVSEVLVHLGFFEGGGGLRYLELMPQYYDENLQKTHSAGFHFPLRGLTTLEFNDHIMGCRVTF